MILINKEDYTIHHVKEVKIRETGTVQVYHETSTYQTVGDRLIGGYVEIFPPKEDVEIFKNHSIYLGRGVMIEDAAYRLII
jgi:hypothetical protein